MTYVETDRDRGTEILQQYWRHSNLGNESPPVSLSDVVAYYDGLDQAEGQAPYFVAELGADAAPQDTGSGGVVGLYGTLSDGLMSDLALRFPDSFPPKSELRQAMLDGASKLGINLPAIVAGAVADTAKTVGAVALGGLGVYLLIIGVIFAMPLILESRKAAA